MTIPPPKRSFPEKEEYRGPKEVDAAGRAQKLQAFGWALYGGVPLGVAGGFLIGNVFLGLVLGPAITIGGKGAKVIYMPSGSSTPRKREYSRAKALEVREDYEGAIRAYEVAILDEPEVAQPYLEIARIFRDELRDHEGAVRWFHRAQREASLSSGEAIRTHRELAEIFLHTRREPRKAAPELARLAEGYPSTLDGEWAARELAQIKEEMEKELDDRVMGE
jgi:tetratricopeptide (TPR) repeat protein